MTEAISIKHATATPPPEETHSYGKLRLLSVNEARKILGIRATTLKGLIVQGRIDAIEINGKYKLSLMSINKFVNSNESQNKSNLVNNPQDEKSIINEILNKYI